MKIPYRPEIDGLRTVAVFAVIIYHANFILFNYPFFKGGFIGVDIFFVISGYLITTLILKEIFQSNKFSFKYFYERRIRRILPVLFFIIVVTSIVSYFILLPSSLVDFGKSVLSVIFFGSNIYFNYTDNLYGREDSLLKPLLHTWSLSIEEQFYILLPIFLIIVIRFYKKYLLTILFLSFLISLLFSEYSSKSYPSFNFFWLLPRGFELFIGSLLSYLELKYKDHQKSYFILNQICPSLGIILIIYSFLFFDFKKISHPSTITLIPLVGVSLIIWFSKKGELITNILSSKIFIFFGLISYSLYLWHYPIFAYLKYIQLFNNNIWIKLLAIIITIILSIFSYYLIEKPFRNKNIVPTKILGAYLFINIICLLSYIFIILNTNGIKSRFKNIVPERFNCSSFPIEEKDYSKIISNNKFKQNVFLIGDSHAESLKFILNEELQKINYNLFPFITCNIYLYFQNFQKVNLKNDFNQKYIQRNKNIEKFLSQEKGIVIISQRWTKQIFEITNYLPLDLKEEKEKYLTIEIKSAIQTIVDQGHALILIYPFPEMSVDVSLELNKLIVLNTFNKITNIPTITVDYDFYKNVNKIIFETLDNIQGPNIYRVYPHKSFCNTVIVNKCIANNKNRLFYTDGHHLSLEGSKYITNDIIKTILKIEINK